MANLPFEHDFPGFPDNKVSTGFAPRPIACDRNNDIPGKHPGNRPLL